jgi:pseudouridine-5'-phosphate glycosidase
MHNWPLIVDIASEVADALRRGQPVVALESAVISHGLPPPIGQEASAAQEEQVRKAGAVPATVAVLAGRIKVGATARERDQLTASGAIKISARDLPVAAALSATGGTTVSATITVADLVGIRVIATGGIGGVHLGAEQTWDVSADLRALAEHPVAVVCTGAKAICDIGKTLEFLDTAGVTVVAYGTDNFPNFYARESGFLAPRRIDTPRDVASILVGKWSLEQRTAVVVANPIPTSDALGECEVVDAVQRATAKAAAAGVRGGDLTPYLLAVLADLTGGRSLRANLALLQANAALAGEVAVAVSQAK